MMALISLMLVLVLSLLVTRVATLVLIHTGVSRELAKFQARSAFTGVGYTTAEAEQIVAHPVRRRVILLLMLLGNAGIVTSITSLTLTFVRPNEGPEGWVNLGLILLGIAVLWFLARSRWMDHLISQVTVWGLRRWTHLDVRDYVSLLHLAGEYGVSEMRVQPDDWMADRTLAELELRQEGITVLGIQRENGRYIGSPNGHYYIRPHDVLLLYGRSSVLSDLDERRPGLGGDIEHQAAISKQQALVWDQDQADQEDVAHHEPHVKQ
jgi:uncharacterized membrane protein